MKSFITAIVAFLTIQVSLFGQFAQPGDPFASPDQFGADAGEANPQTKSELLVDSKSIAPGQTIRFALKFTHPDHWHSYYKNDGIGISQIPAIAWTLPEGFVASDIIFPAPKEFLFLGMNSYGYEGTNYFITEITAPKDLKSGTELEFKAEASWQICKEQCLQEDSTFSVKLPVTENAEANPDYAKELSGYMTKKVPTKTLPASWNLSADEKDGIITLSISSKLPEDAFFYEYDKQIDAQKPRELKVTDTNSTFTGQRNTGNDFSEAPEKKDHLRGILYTPSKVEGSSNHAFWIDVKIGAEEELAPSGTDAEAAADSDKEKPLGVAVTFAFLFLGGLILNLMPCVFPVIGLKIMGFVQQAGEDKSKIKLHGVAFTVGVLLSFLALAAFLYPIKGETTLGAQLQNPLVVFIVLIIMLLLGLSMSGVFEIGAKATSIGGNLAQKEGVSGSFFSGILAVIVATPCSAPFLGPAIGAAWNYEGPLFFAALLTMGVGLALPYIILSFFPALVNSLPRPGAWMESFKQGMAFLLYATAGYLIWVYMGQVGDAHAGQKGLHVMLGLTTIAAAAWIYGRWDTPIRKMKVRIIAKALTALFFVGGLALALPPKEEAEVSENTVAEFDWQKWSPEAVEKHLAEGKAVYVDFTAKWCLTCQSNKATAYTDEVRQMFYDNNIVVLKADMTKKHPTATKAVHDLGRSAIPVNVLYVPGDKTPHVTSEILTAGYMKDFIKQHIKPAEQKEADLEK
ncbi:thiol:disulfide interchange protein DsbD [Rubritalea squalenifaciens DSM 18772]|uniref:Thiol:disulfide interchange protein DsbD n=1 Tax=Rubritalea squalenifaciens DSM 18772 TaxID=1123071 RepID=A0A1M6JI48_9BACT|nr:thioredoxin family protein [Rubritalea squalenifaciens]SHJ46302.1 thiol:disulfide interchange protein DsbD [Rubritalea squalenifaciens DSM 18772]